MKSEKCIAKDICNCHKDSNGTLKCPEHSHYDFIDKIIESHGKPTGSKRKKDWLEFSDVVAKHIEEYTVPQYGDKGDDLITGYTVEDCMTHIIKYARRYGQQSREGQQQLDFLKIAHFAQCAWEKYDDSEKVVEDTVIILETKSDELMTDRGYFYVGCANYTDGTPTRYVYKRRGK